MATIKLNGGFSVIPEGTYVFKVTNVSYKEEYGKLEVTMQTQTGLKHIERFSLLKNDNSPNEGALNAFSYFAKVVLNDFTRDEIDHKDLIGHFVECDVTHDDVVSKKDPNKIVTFARLTDKRVSDGWEETDAPAPKVAQKSPVTTGSDGKPKVDLKSLLG